MMIVPKEIHTAKPEEGGISNMTEADFLTPEEREQINSLMAKAAERMRKSREKSPDRESCQFLFLRCQQECRKQMEQKEQAKEELEQDIEILLNQICTFCRKHCLPVCGKEDSSEEEEELPFPR